MAKQFGVLYIPLVIMEKFGLIEKQAAARGLTTLKAEYVQLGTGAAMNDALLSGTLDFVSTGAPSLLVLWDKTRGGVRGVAALNATAQYLLTTNPNVKTIADFSNGDRIAVTSVKISTQALFLQMGAAKLWGKEYYNRLDPLTVTRAHPDAITATLSHSKDLNAYFAASPYQERALRDPEVRKIATSYELTGIDFLTPTLLITTERFARQNPTISDAVIAAADEAVAYIRDYKREAAEIYIDASQDNVTVEDVVAVLSSPETKLTIVPNGVMKVGEFLAGVGAITSKPSSIGNLFLKIPGIEGGS
ncbi:ABC transporter substrate-binding protein [Methylobacterium sp. NEAU 140]|uniref:ABC transporter substrate-binding protein n=1 Tax=Methylobacterium sp. NEAU 140 TaxID=3064945 RepID=UPI002736EE61|nr:ABC transporter substrate-binding protein [Methylobacterium sp. NEAU 140]MDP4026573.1 ABC transporter substrate-binding protein [Methylobacterium sp. NEAU 140]